MEGQVASLEGLVAGLPQNQDAPLTLLGALAQLAALLIDHHDVASARPHLDRASAVVVALGKQSLNQQQKDQLETYSRVVRGMQVQVAVK